MTPTVPILHEDAALLVVAKPPGVAVIPGRDEGPADSLKGRLEAARGERLWVVHRIDRDTSGVLVFARDADAHRTLSLAFEHRRVEKYYLAWTAGVPSPGTIDVALHPARKGKMRPAHPGEPGALESRTDVVVEHRRDTLLGPVARVAASPHTGRQHQIRVHLRFAGAPLLVDTHYGPHDALDAGALGPGSPAVPRLTLHAASISFEHPRDGRTLRIDAPPPEDLATLDAWLRRP